MQKVSGIGGSERHLLSLLPALAEAGVEVRMCVAATGRAADFIDRLRESGVSHSIVGAGPTPIRCSSPRCGERCDRFGPTSSTPI